MGYKLTWMYIWQTKIRPATWNPWANTLCYYNINSNDTTATIYDLSGNWNDLTWYGNWAYATDANAWKVADFDGSSYASLGGYINPWWTAYTLVVRWKYQTAWTYVAQWSSSSYLNSVSITNTDFTYTKQAVPWSWLDFNTTQSSDTWAMLVWVRDGNDIKVYYNWVLDWTTTNNDIQTDWTSWGYWQLWANRQVYGKLTGQIKTVIWENKAWTAEDVNDYFELTKWDFWIS